MSADNSYHMVLDAIREFSFKQYLSKNSGQAMLPVTRNSFQTLNNVIRDITSKQGTKC